jgi:hypothetical protein
MRFRSFIAILGWVGGAASCTSALGWDTSGYTARATTSAGGSGGAGGGATEAGGSGGQSTTSAGGHPTTSTAKGGSDAGTTTTSACAADCKADGGWCDPVYGWCVYDWARWPMPSWKGSGLPHESSYTVKNGTVKDEVTGLVWQRHVEKTACDGAPSCTWYEAHVYCKELALDGGGWRLPSSIELVSLLDYSQGAPGKPMLDPDAFASEPAEWYWSASCHEGPCTAKSASELRSAWYVDFVSGLVNRADGTTAHYVRCVR